MNYEQWKPITEPVTDRVLVTNNITARDAYGKMSHVWIGFILAADNPNYEGEWVTYGDDDRKITNLTHYCEIPQAAEVLK
jgi:hypothetical protein